MELSYAAVCFDLYGTLVDANGSAIPGAREALESLSSARWAIVTSCGRAFARRLIECAGLSQPQVLVSNDDVVRGKPAPDPYLAGARLLNVDAADALAIEDSRGGIDAAREAGLEVVAILAGRGLAFARRASFQVERFADIGWSVSEDGSIRVRIEP